MKKISIALAALLLAAALPVAVLAEGMTAPVTPEVPGTPAGSATTAPVTPAPVSPTAAAPTNTPAPKGIPVVTKDPKDETVKEGGRCPFTSRASNDKGRTWYFVSPDGEELLTVKEAKARFKGVAITGEHEEKLVITKTPYSMNGWKVLCNFYNSKGNVDSAMALITVIPKGTTAKPTTTAKATAGVTTGTATDAPTTSAATDIPTPTPTVAPTDIPTATPTAAPSDVPEPPADTPVPSPIPEKDGGNTVLTVALAALGVLLVGGGAGTAVILSKRNKSTLTDEDDGDLDE